MPVRAALLITASVLGTLLAVLPAAAEPGQAPQDEKKVEGIQLKLDYTVCLPAEGDPEREKLEDKARTIVRLQAMGRERGIDEKRWREFVQRSQGAREDFFTCVYDVTQLSMKELRDLCLKSAAQKGLCSQKNIADVFRPMREITAQHWADEKPAGSGLKSRPDQKPGLGLKLSMDKGDKPSTVERLDALAAEAREREANSRRAAEFARLEAAANSDAAARREAERERRLLESRAQNAAAEAKKLEEARVAAEQARKAAEAREVAEKAAAAAEKARKEAAAREAEEKERIAKAKAAEEAERKAAEARAAEAMAAAEAAAAIAKAEAERKANEGKIEAVAGQVPGSADSALFAQLERERLKKEQENAERLRREAELNCLRPPVDANRIKDAIPDPAQIVRNAACQELEVGQQEIYNTDWHQSPSKNEQRYRLRRLDEKTYEVAVNLNFGLAKNLTAEGREAMRKVGVNPEDVQDIFRRRTKECFAAINNNLLGPGGKQMKLALSEPDARDVPKTDIEVGHPGQRGHYKLYAADFPCSTITHEVLHILGLCDEYQENAWGYAFDPVKKEVVLRTSNYDVTAYDCRAIGPKYSIMNSHYEAFERVFGKMEVRTCYCAACKMETNGSIAREQAKQASIETFRNWRDTSKCPTDGAGRATSMMATESAFDRREGAKFDNNTFELELVHKPEDDYDKIGARRSLLLPAHFNTIIYPGCMAKNADYYKCSPNAMSSTKRKVSYEGREFEIGEGCPVTLPPECRITEDGKYPWLFGR